jgi:O-antigen/teichoic acid export membrane protein
MGRIRESLERLAGRIFQNPLILRVVKNSGYLFSATGISSAISMLQGILIARLLGVAGFGILGVITMFTSVVNKLISFRMGEMVVKYVGQHMEAGDAQRAAAVYKLAALLETVASLLAFGLVCLLAPLGARYLAKDMSTQGWFILYGLIIIANLISESNTGLLQIFDRFRNLASLNVAQSVLTLSIIVLVYLDKGGFGGVLIAYLVGKTAGALALMVVTMLHATKQWGHGWWRVSLNLLKSQKRELLNFAISTNISASLSLINKDSELLWVSLLRNPIETGYYKLALALANIVQLPIAPLPQATYPELSRENARGNWRNMRTILKQGSIMAGSYTLLAGLGLALFGKMVIHYLYGDEFLPAFPALMILLVGFLVANTFYWNRTALLAIGRPDFPAKVNFVLVVLKILGILWLTPKFGYLANAGLLSGSYILGVSACVLFFFILLKEREKEA